MCRPKTGCGCRRPEARERRFAPPDLIGHGPEQRPAERHRETGQSDRRAPWTRSGRVVRSDLPGEIGGKQKRLNDGGKRTVHPVVQRPANELPPRSGTFGPAACSPVAAAHVD